MFLTDPFGMFTIRGMAKITARNATEIARIKTELSADDPVKYLWVLRSDGKVLRRLTGDVSTNYTIIGRLANAPAEKSAGAGALARIAIKRGHTVVA